MSRRAFLGSAPLLLFGARPVRALQQQPAPRGSDLREELSPEEIEIVTKSAMAKDIDNFFGKGFS